MEGNTIFALVSCNDVDTSSTTSVVTPSSSIITPSSYSETSSIETSSIEITSSVEESSRVEESSVEESSIIEESSSESLATYYHVKFVNYDDSLLYEVDVLEGDAATYVGETPTKPDYEIYEYAFTGWDKDLTVINSDLTTKAQYEEEVKEEEQGWGPIHWFN